MRTLKAFVLALAAAGSSLGSETTLTNHHPAKEDTYTITSVIQVLNPVNPDDMNDDFQDVRVLKRDKDSCTLEITYYPLFQQTVGENPNWREEDAGMTEYLKPTPTENWDEAMRRDLTEDLHQAGIEPERLTDKELVEKVSVWAMHRSHSASSFCVWDVYFPDGKPVVYPQLRDAFDKEKPNPSWTDEQMFGQEVLGRSMFYNKVHGSCTSSSVYMATILRALGIPTRIVLCIPPLDPNDPAQYQMFQDNIHNFKVRDVILAGTHNKGSPSNPMFCNHLFNEVYVGHHWVRLNYTRLGQPILDPDYFGLLTHIYTTSDLSKVPLAQTWGTRLWGLTCKQYPADQPKLSSVNPYQLISVQDHFGTNAHLDNPPVPELTTVTIIGLYRPDASEIPAWARAHDHRSFRILISTKEWLSGTYMQMTEFWQRAGHDFLLTSTNHPDIHARLVDARYSSGNGDFQAYGAEVVPEDVDKVDSGAAYSIHPKNISDKYRWVAAPDLVPVVLKN